MIEVLITKSGGEELARIRIEGIRFSEDGQEGDYSVQFAVNRASAVGLHQRGIFGFPRTRYNALALLRQALDTLDPKELELEDDTSASDLARKVRRALPPFQRRKG